MGTTPKMFQMAGMTAEKGLIADQSPGWGVNGSYVIPGADEGFPWLEFGKEKSIQLKEDASVVGQAFSAPSRQTGYRVDNPLNFLARFDDFNYPYYWMMGFENKVKTVVVCTSVLGFTGAGLPVAYDDSFSDGGTNDFTYLRSVTMKTLSAEPVTYHYFVALDAAPASTATLTHGSGGTAIQIILSDCSPLLYEHIFEFDGKNRTYREYTAAEILQIDGHTTGDKKNLAATLGLRMSDYDFLFPNSICKNFTYSVKGEDMAMWETNFCSSDQLRDTGLLDDVTFIPELMDNFAVPAHYQHGFYLGTTLANMGELCITDISIKAEIPLAEIQTMCSGLHISEPKLTNKYKVTGSMMIPFHDAETYMNYRDAQNRLCGTLRANQGWNSLEFLFKRITINKSGPDSGDIAAEPIEFEISRCPASEDVFADTLGTTQVYDNSPFCIRVVNTVSTNAMRLV
jgi:hypothetical protein